MNQAGALNNWVIPFTHSDVIILGHTNTSHLNGKIVCITLQEADFDISMVQPIVDKQPKIRLQAFSKTVCCYCDGQQGMVLWNWGSNVIVTLTKFETTILLIQLMWYPIHAVVFDAERVILSRLQVLAPMVLKPRTIHVHAEIDNS